MSGYVLGVDADFDLDDIREYIAADNIDAADRWIQKLFDTFEALGRTPGMGHRREDLTPYPALFWPVGAYLSWLPEPNFRSPLGRLRTVRILPEPVASRFECSSAGTPAALSNTTNAADRAAVSSSSSPVCLYAIRCENM